MLNLQLANIHVILLPPFSSVVTKYITESVLLVRKSYQLSKLLIKTFMNISTTYFYEGAEITVNSN